MIKELILKLIHMIEVSSIGVFLIISAYRIVDHDQHPDHYMVLDHPWYLSILVGVRYIIIMVIVLEIIITINDISSK